MLKILGIVAWIIIIANVVSVWLDVQEFKGLVKECARGNNAWSCVMASNLYSEINDTPLGAFLVERLRF